jgi:hypothetical protein
VAKLNPIDVTFGIRNPDFVYSWDIYNIFIKNDLFYFYHVTNVGASSSKACIYNV